MSSTSTVALTLRSLEHCYTPASVVHLSKSIGVIDGFSYSHSLAAVRTILQHLNCCKASKDNPGGLHPMYISLCCLAHSIDEKRVRRILLRDTLSDVLDVVRENFHVSYRKLKNCQILTLDRIDGRISFFVRCPGYCIPSDFVVQDVSIDTYISPHEVGLSDGSAAVQEQVALLIQQFGEKIVLPHLRHFMAHSQVEGIRDVQAPCSSFSNQHFPITYVYCSKREESVCCGA